MLFGNGNTLCVKTDCHYREYSVGFVDEEMLRAHLPPAGPDTLILLCGPPPMIEYACLPALKALGHAPENILVF